MKMIDRIFRVPSKLLSEFEPGMRTCDVGKKVDITYAYAYKVVTTLLKYNIIVVDMNTLLDKNKKYNLTGKGVELKNHLIGIVEGVRNGEISHIPKEK